MNATLYLLADGYGHFSRTLIPSYYILRESAPVRIPVGNLLPLQMHCILISNLMIPQAQHPSPRFFGFLEIAESLLKAVRADVSPDVSP